MSSNHVEQELLNRIAQPEAEEHEQKAPEPEKASETVTQEQFVAYVSTVQTYLSHRVAYAETSSTYTLEASTTGMNASQEILAQTKQELGLDAQLAAIHAEVAALLQQAQQELAAAMQEQAGPDAGFAEAPTDAGQEAGVSAQSPSIDDEVAASAPVVKPAQQKESLPYRIHYDDEGNKVQTLIGAEAIRAADANAAAQAEQPVFLQSATAEQPAPDVQEITEESQPDVPRMPEVPAIRETREIMDVLQKAGLDAEMVGIPNNPDFPNVIVLPRKEVPQEKTVRVYRGIRDFGTMLKQEPYAMRAHNPRGGVTIIESVRSLVDAMAHNPSYDTIIQYMEAMKPHLSQSERDYMEEYELPQIERDILKGKSAREALAWTQIGHGGGVADTGISPYVSASYNINETVGYAGDGGAVLVMDVPISELEHFNDGGGEVSIKGSLKPEYISAVLPYGRKPASRSQEKHDEAALARALDVINQHDALPATTPEEIETFRSEVLEGDAQRDQENRSRDLEQLRQARVARLAQKFPGIQVDEIDERGDIYTQTKEAIYDHYAQKYVEMRQKYYPNDPEPIDSKYYDRDDITEEKLLEMRRFVNRRIELEEEYAWEREQRQKRRG